MLTEQALERNQLFAPKKPSTSSRLVNPETRINHCSLQPLRAKACQKGMLNSIPPCVDQARQSLYRHGRPRSPLHGGRQSILELSRLVDSILDVIFHDSRHCAGTLLPMSVIAKELNTTPREICVAGHGILLLSH